MRITLEISDKWLIEAFDKLGRRKTMFVLLLLKEGLESKSGRELFRMFTGEELPEKPVRADEKAVKAKTGEPDVKGTLNFDSFI